MAKTVIEGYLVQEKYELDGKKSKPKNLGVVFEEYEAQALIERESEYYEEQPFKYSRTIMENGIAYCGKNEMIMYTYEKCLVIIGD